jgi:hypothetical protein
MKHPHDAIIRSWLDGVAIEVKVCDGWAPYASGDDRTHMPLFDVSDTFRIKPKEVEHAVLRDKTYLANPPGYMLVRASNIGKYSEYWDDTGKRVWL